MDNHKQFVAFDIDGTIWPHDIEGMWLNQLVEDNIAPIKILKKTRDSLKNTWKEDLRKKNI
jgi:hypothetical protein